MSTVVYSRASSWAIGNWCVNKFCRAPCSWVVSLAGNVKEAFLPEGSTWFEICGVGSRVAGAEGDSTGEIGQDLAAPSWRWYSFRVTGEGGEVIIVDVWISFSTNGWAVDVNLLHAWYVFSTKSLERSDTEASHTNNFQLWSRHHSSDY